MQFKFRPRSIQETESATPANAMGGSSSVAGSGGIDVFDPLLKRKSVVKHAKKLRDIVKKD